MSGGEARWLRGAGYWYVRILQRQTVRLVGGSQEMLVAVSHPLRYLLISLFVLL